jgi:peptidoglycan L-alanyl-D-glutamate endopeptidase CwlK
MFLQNPANPAPEDVIAALTEVEVSYVDFTGQQQTGVIEIHRELAEDVDVFFALALDLGFPIERVVRSSDGPYYWDDNRLMADNCSSGFNFRNIAKTNRPSLHGLGRALDINTRHNPFVKIGEDGQVVQVDPPGAIWVPFVPGTLHADHRLVQLMEGRGWEWGGRWHDTRVDYQHFQKAT